MSGVVRVLVCDVPPSPKTVQVFDSLPVGAMVEDRILCIHGGIGGSIHTLQDISELKRPLSVSQMPTNETVGRARLTACRVSDLPTGATRQMT